MDSELANYLYKIYITTEIEEELYKRLKEIWNFDNFIFGVISDLKRKEDKLKMLELLKQGLTDRDDIMEISSDMSDKYVEEWLSTEIKTELTKKLSKKLREINDYDYFVYGVLSNLGSEENRQKVIDAIDNGLRDPNEIDDYVSKLKKGL